MDAVTLRTSILSDPNLFNHNKTAPTSPSSAANIYSQPLNKRLLLNDSLVREEGKITNEIESDKKLQNAISEETENKANAKTLSKESPQRKDTAISDNSLNQTQARAKRSVLHRHKTRKSSCCVC